jgi:hypothetical protein
MVVRARLLSAVATLTLATVILVAPPVSAHHRPGPCDADRRADETIQHFMKRKITCAVDLFGPVTGLYLGLYQHAAAAWPDRYQRWTDPAWDLSSDALNGRTNAIVTIRMVHAAGTWKDAGWPSNGC